MHLSALGLAPLLFALGTHAASFTYTSTNSDGTVAVLRGCYVNANFNFFDTTGGSGGKTTMNSFATSPGNCASACNTAGYTFAMIQGSQSKLPVHTTRESLC